jgi:quinoprotein dehydrogenase-associated probable ABC transporter substrate-binding protein
MNRICPTSLLLLAASVALGLGFLEPSLARAAPTVQGATVPSTSHLDTRNGALKRDFNNKEFQDLTPSERIAIRAAAKTAYKNKTLDSLVVCADPGNMPFSNEKGQGFENKIAELLGKATGAKITFYWRPSYERGMMRQTFGTGMCDAMIDIPTNYESLLTTVPIYRTTYVLAYRNDENLHIKNLDDPELRKLTIGVYETSGARQVLLKHGIFDNVTVQTVSHDADINLKDQPWHQVQQVVDGKLDAAAVWGPFAGWVKAKGEPITIQPMNLWEDTIPLEFDLGIGVRKTDVMLKYILDFAIEDHKTDIQKILNDYGVPLVQCSRCVVEGTLPAHGSYNKVVQATELPPLPAAEEAATLKSLKARLAAGADPSAELSDAIDADDAARVKLLASHGADVNKRDLQGYTPLTSAARQRYSDLVKLLLDLKADPNVRDRDNMTPLLEAVMRNDVPSVKLLLAHGADKSALGPEGIDALGLAIEERDYDAAKTLIEAGANVNVVVGDQRLTPLMIAAAEKAPPEGAIFVPSSTRPIDIARILIQRGANVNATDKTGMTALMVAASHNNAPMVGLLLQSGADVAAKNDQGQTASDIAKLNGNVDAAQAISVLGKMRSAAQASPPSQPSHGTN